METETVMALVRDAQDSGAELDTDVARIVAGYWHDGQGSAFYAFSSSGHYARADLLHELSRTIGQCYASASADDRLQLDMLGTYFVNRDDNRDDYCADCDAPLTADNAFHPYGDCRAVRCKDCERAAWARIRALQANRPGVPGNDQTNVWD